MKTNKSVLSDIARLVHYDPKTGIFTWLPRPRCMFRQECSWRTWNTRFAFKPAGRVDNLGYVSISFGGKKVKAHRLAYFVTHGGCPELLDHINGRPADNRISNLRQASPSQNGMNRAMDRRNKSGCKGISWHKKAGKWQVHVRSNGSVHYCGLFIDLDAARSARERKAIELHGEFSCDGIRHAA